MAKQQKAKAPLEQRRAHFTKQVVSQTNPQIADESSVRPQKISFTDEVPKYLQALQDFQERSRKTNEKLRFD